MNNTLSLNNSPYIIITGATGVIGSYLTSELKNHGYKVLPLKHGMEVGTKWIDSIHLDLASDISNHNMALLNSLRGKVAGIVHCASIVNEQSSAHDLIETNLRITRGLIEICQLLKPTWLLNLSTVAVYGAKFEEHFFDEKHVPLPTSIYGVSKLAAEGYLNSLLADSMYICHFRLGYVLSPNLKSSTALFQINKKISKNEHVQLTEPTNNLFNLVDVQDITKVIQALYVMPRRGIFNFVNPEVMTLQQIYDLLSDKFNIVSSKIRPKINQKINPATNSIINTTTKKFEIIRSDKIMRTRYSMSHFMQVFPEVHFRDIKETLKDYSKTWTNRIL